MYCSCEMSLTVVSPQRLIGSMLHGSRSCQSTSTVWKAQEALAVWPPHVAGLGYRSDSHNLRDPLIGNHSVARLELHESPEFIRLHRRLRRGRVRICGPKGGAELLLRLEPLEVPNVIPPDTDVAVRSAVLPELSIVARRDLDDPMSERRVRPRAQEPGDLTGLPTVEEAGSDGQLLESVGASHATGSCSLAAQGSEDVRLPGA